MELSFYYKQRSPTLFPIPLSWSDTLQYSSNCHNLFSEAGKDYRILNEISVI